MIWRIILWGSLIWLPYMMYRVLGGEAKFTKNIVVGVTMPFEAHEDAEVCRRLAKFKKELGIVCAVLTAAVVPCVFIRSVGTGAENLLKGDFSAAEYGRLKLCLDPTCPPFLLVECAGGETYLLGSRTEGETEVIFGEIGA